ncbi:hypothetical protein G6K93_07680 [Agrobacterium rhizogenes]|nr:hypothetical protein [Rhizobium rhizogenes]
MVENQAASDSRDNTDFASLDQCCYMRRATAEDGRLCWVLFNSDGDAELATDIRSDVFFYAHKRELKLVWLN